MQQYILNDNANVNPNVNANNKINSSDFYTRDTDIYMLNLNDYSKYSKGDYLKNLDNIYRKLDTNTKSIIFDDYIILQSKLKYNDKIKLSIKNDCIDRALKLGVKTCIDEYCGGIMFYATEYNYEELIKLNIGIMLNYSVINH